MSKMLLQKILSGTVVKPQPVVPKQNGESPVKNPFLQNQSLDTDKNVGEYGVNRPLKQAMFVGYRDDKPIYAGSRLFVLY